MLTISLTVTAVVGIAVVINKTFNKESDVSNKPQHQRVIKKTN